MIAMLAMCMAITSYELTGKPVECNTQYSSQFPDKDMMNAYCMAENLYTVRQKVGNNSKWPAVQIYPGIPAHYHGWENDIIEHKYYRYIPLFLVFQAFCFHMTYKIWKFLEGGQLENIIQDLNVKGQTLDEKREELIKHSATAIKTMKSSNLYLLKYYFCMFLNLINVFLQFTITHFFINDGEFFFYGYDVVKYYAENTKYKPKYYKDYDPMLLVFPRQAKCTLRMFGISGTVENREALCFLALNSFNDKMFLGIWWWFIALAAVTALSIAYGFAYYAFHGLYLRKTSGKVGDIFILKLLKSNVDHITFSKIVVQLETLHDSNNKSEDIGLLEMSDMSEFNEEETTQDFQSKLDDYLKKNPPSSR